MINEVTFNNVNFWEELGVVLKDPPSYPIPAEIKEQVKVKGANGSLTESTGYFNDLELKLSFRKLTTFGEPQYKQINDFKYKINTIFNNVPTTQSNLIFSEVPNKYYKVKSCKVGAVTKISQYEYDFEVDFICDPFLYRQDEIELSADSNTITFQYEGDVPNAPLITLTSTGAGKVRIYGKTSSIVFTMPGAGTYYINQNPYSIVTKDNGTPIITSGNYIVCSKGANTIYASEDAKNQITRIKVKKNERYLG